MQLFIQLFSEEGAAGMTSVVLHGQEFCREQKHFGTLQNSPQGGPLRVPPLLGVWSGLGSPGAANEGTVAGGLAQTGTGLHRRFAGRWQSPVVGPPMRPGPGQTRAPRLTAACSAQTARVISTGRFVESFVLFWVFCLFSAVGVYSGCLLFCLFVCF